MNRAGFERVAGRKFKLQKQDFEIDQVSGRYTDPVTQSLWEIYNLGRHHYIKERKPRFIIGKSVSHGVIVMSPNPRWYDDPKVAEAEAKRLVDVTGGNKFFIFSEWKSVEPPEGKKKKPMRAK